MKRIRGIVITGRPGSGKTTLFNALIKEAQSRGIRPAGFSCPEVRVGGRRIGFRIRNIASGEEGWLARINGCLGGPRIGRYHVCVNDAVRIGVQALEKTGEAGLLGIDELGPMELGIPILRDTVVEALAHAERYIVVAHFRLRDPVLLKILRKPDARWVTVYRENRSRAWDGAFSLLEELL